MLSELRRIDMSLLLPVLLLLAIGLEMVFSASFVVGHNEFGDGAYFLARHLLWIGFGVTALMVAARLDYHLWPRVALPLFVGSLVLLGLVLLPGVGQVSYGSARWLPLGSVGTVQPSELTKLALILYLASWLARVGEGIHQFSLGTIPFTLILCLTAGLVLLEPNVGTALVLAITAASIFFVAGASVLHALGGALLAASALAGLTAFMRSWSDTGYWSERIGAFLNPWAHPEGIGWQTTQTLLALGSGGVAGLGLGAGRQKYYYVPNAHTDSIYAIVGEEIGFIGTTLVLGLFLFFAWRGLALAYRAPDRLGRLLATGVTSVLVWQALLNMAVISNAVPYTGVPLPFVSYGGSAMVMSLAAVGILLSVGRAAARRSLP